MEPIRPDDDELRATRDTKTGERQEKKSAKAGKPPKKGKDGGNGGGSGGAGGKRSSGPFLLILLLVVAVTGAFGWYQQNDRIEQMEGQLEEAEYWARQSKLALARFEGELSETGENLQEKGQSIEQQLGTQRERLDNADSEIRKLWGVANDRNKSRLNAHEARLETLDKQIAEAASKRQALSSGLAELESSLESEIASLESSVDQKLSDQGRRLDKLQTSVATVDDQVESRLKRFQREQSLALDGLEGRISSLEKTTQALSGDEIESIRSELDTLKQTVASIDASRAQLTSRLVRLSEEVSQLRAGGQ